MASRELVANRCEVAAASGVVEGMTLAHARSLIPTGMPLWVELMRPERDAAALHSLACWALRYSPLAAPDPPDGLMLDITGTHRVYRSEAHLVRMMAKALFRLGFPSRIAVASTFGAAWGLARFSNHPLCRVNPENQRKAIERLPVAALRIDQQTVLSLAEVGLTEVGHVLRLPRASLVARFDKVVIHRVLQLLGAASERIEPVRLKPPLRNEMVFAGPTDHWESIESAAKQVLDALMKDLAVRQRGVRQLHVELRRPYAESHQFVVNLSRPSAAVKHLWSMCRPQLERLHLADGVEGVVMIATRTARLRHEQNVSRELGASEEQFASSSAWGELLDTLICRLGDDNVVRMHAVESHLPERAFREQSVMTPATRLPVASVMHADRPTHLFSRPEPAEAMAMTPDGPIFSLLWRGERWNVRSCSLPERISPEWWRWQSCDEGETVHAARSRRGLPPPPPDRDYFAVQLDSGRWLWVCRHVREGTTERWFVHGEWR